MPISLVPETNDPPAVATLIWTQPIPPPALRWHVRTNDLLFATTVVTNCPVTNPIGPVIKFTVTAEGTNGLFSIPADYLWTNVFYQKPVTNVLTFSALSSPTKPTNLRVGNNVANWQPFSLTNPTGNGTTLFWVPLKGTNTQVVQCRTGQIGTNLFTDGQGLARWPAFIGSGYYWVVLTTTNL